MTLDDTRALRTNVLNPSVQADAGPHSPTDNRGGRTWIILIVVVLVAGGIGYAWRRYHAASAAPAAGGAECGGPVPVVTAVARKGNFNQYINGLGTVTAFNTVTLRSRVDGQVVKVNFTEGQSVKQGELLAEIDPHPYQATLLAAQGQLAKDQANLANAQVDLQRYKDLLKQSLSVTQQQVDTQQALVNQLAGSVEADKGQVQSAQVNLNYCEISAPLSGRIGLRLVDQGNIVHANDTAGLAVITQLQPIAVIFTIRQDDIPEVQKAMRTAGGPLAVDAFSSDLKTKLASGTLLALDNQVDPATGTLRVKASIPNENNNLFPNEFVNARLLVSTLQGVVLVPDAAVQRGPDSNFAYVVKPDQTVELKTIQLGPSQGDNTVIESGLNPGDVVVTDGVDKLKPGAKVSAAMAKAPRGQGASTRPAGAATAPAGDDAGETNASADLPRRGAAARATTNLSASKSTTRSAADTAPGGGR